MGRLLSAALLAAVVPTVGACGPSAVRGSEVAGLDDDAMGTGLDKKDLQELLFKNMKALQASPVIDRWKKEDRPRVAVLPIENGTSEHIDSALDAFLSDVETALVNAGHLRVIARDMQPQLIEEVRRQYSEAFDLSKASQWGKQVGAKYFVTGKVFTSDERFRGERRVQYFMFFRVVDAETSEIVFQNKAEITKAITR